MVSQDPKNLLSEVLARWHAGEAADTRTALVQHPVLAGRKSCVVELAYEEWCQKVEGGSALDIEQYCERFSICASSLRMRLEVDAYCRENPDLFQVRWPAKGEFFGELELMAELGSGAMGHVYLARDHELGERPLVLKLAVDAADEADTLSRVSHPGIVPLHFARFDAKLGLYGICMPFLSRTTLQDVLDYRLAGEPEGYCDVLRALQIEYDDARELAAVREATPAAEPPEDFVQVVAWLGARLAAALAHVHARGIQHLDLKPSNILVTPAGAPMLIDFNLSRHKGSNSPYSGGTPQYMSPEQLAGFAAGDAPRRQVSSSSDVYSLGVILYELLARRHPLAPLPKGLRLEAAANVLRERQARPLVSPAERLPGADAELCETILRCLAERPEDRPTAAQLAEDFESQLTILGRTRRWVGLHRRSLLAAGIGFAAAATGLGWYWSTRPTPTQHHTDLGWQQYRAGDVKAAEASFSAALDADTGNADAWFGRGRARTRLRKSFDAVDDFRRAERVRTDPRYAAAMAYVALSNGSPAVAERELKRAAEGGLETAAVWCDIGYSQRLQTLFTPAERSLRHALELDPEHSLARLNLIRVTLQQLGALKPSTPAQVFASDIVTHLDAALLSRPHDPYLRLDAALLRALQLPPEQRAEVALPHLRIAGANSAMDRALFLRIASLVGLEGDREIVDLAQRLPSNPPREPLFADPLPAE